MPEKYININKYVSEKGNELKQILEKNRGKQTLINAPTGSGKTTAIIDIFKQFDSDINILVLPTKILCEQLENKVYPLVAKNSVILNPKNFTNNYSCIYEKADELLNDIRRIRPDLRVNVVIDEIHILIDSISFRKESVESILRLIQYSLNTNGFVAYMSATTDFIDKSFSISQKVFFKSKQRNRIKNINIILNNTNHNTINFSKGILLEYENGLVRYNNKEEQQILATSIAKRVKKECAYINADEKSYTVMCGKKKYNNDCYGDIIERQRIDESIDFLFTTQLLDCGTSIVESKIKNVFWICNDPRQMSINSIVQFANRTRYDIDNYNIIICQDNTKQKPFKTFNKIFTDGRKEAQEILNCINETYKTIKNRPDLSELGKINAFKDHLGYKDFWDCNITKNYVFYDELIDKPYINEIAYNLYCQRLYNSQFFHHIDKLKKELENYFENNINIQIIDELIVKPIDMRAVKEERNNERYLVIDCLKTLTKDTCYKLFACLEDNAIIPDKLKPIFENTEYKSYITRAKNLGISPYRIWNILQDESKTKQELKKYLYQQQIINNNKIAVIDFSENKYSYSNIKIKEQRIILSRFYQLNDCRTDLKENTITKEILKELAEKITNECNKKITPKKTLELIQMIFVLRDLSNGKYKIERIKMA